MKNRIIFVMSLLFLTGAIKPAFALEHTQKSGLFSMNIPEGWHWFDYPEEVVITYPDGSTVALDIQFAPSQTLNLADIKKAIKEGNDKMIRDGIEAHHGTLTDNKEISICGKYAAQLDFKTAPPNPIDVTYVSFFSKGYVFTVTYGSRDEKMHFMLDDVFATLKLQ